MSFYALQQVDKTKYDRITRDYFAFIAAVNNPDKEPVPVFSPLSEKMLGELELIREVSRDLQEKKVREIAKQKAEAEKTEEENAEGEVEAESKTEEDDKTADDKIEGDEKTEVDQTDDTQEEQEKTEE